MKEKNIKKFSQDACSPAINSSGIVFIKNFLSRDQCNTLKDVLKDVWSPERPGTLKNDKIRMDSSIRKCETFYPSFEVIEDHKPINFLHASIFKAAAAHFSKMCVEEELLWDPTGTTGKSSAFLNYCAPDKGKAKQELMYHHFATHTDWLPSDKYSVISSRRLTTSIQLSDGHEYSGGDFKIFKNGKAFTVPREIGTLAMFYPWYFHGVEPITSGTRSAFVLWLSHGPSLLKSFCAQDARCVENGFRKIINNFEGY